MSNLDVEQGNNIASIIKHWNSVGVIVHQSTKLMIKKVGKRMKERSDKLEPGTPYVEQIKQGIDNYKLALDSGKFNYKWNLEEFLMRKNADKFYPPNFIQSNYEPHEEKSIGDLVADLIREELGKGYSTPLREL